MPQQRESFLQTWMRNSNSQDQGREDPYAENREPSRQNGLRVALAHSSNMRSASQPTNASKWQQAQAQAEAQRRQQAQAQKSAKNQQQAQQSAQIASMGVTAYQAYQMYQAYLAAQAAEAAAATGTAAAGTAAAGEGASAGAGAGAGVSAGTLGIVGGVLAAIYGTHVTSAYRAQKERERMINYESRSPSEKQRLKESGPAYSMGWGGAARQSDRLLANLAAKTDPLGSGIIGAINKYGSPGTQIEDARYGQLYAQMEAEGKEGLMPGFNPTQEGGEQQHATLVRRGIDPDYVGMTINPYGERQWVNMKFLKSGNEADLLPEDTWGYSLWGHYFGSGYYEVPESVRRAMNQEALDQGLLVEEYGTVNFTGSEEARKAFIEKWKKEIAKSLGKETPPETTPQAPKEESSGMVLKEGQQPTQTTTTSTVPAPTPTTTPTTTPAPTPTSNDTENLPVQGSLPEDPVPQMTQEELLEQQRAMQEAQMAEARKQNALGYLMQKWSSRDGLDPSAYAPPMPSQNQGGASIGAGYISPILQALMQGQGEPKEKGY